VVGDGEKKERTLKVKTREKEDKKELETSAKVVKKKGLLFTFCEEKRNSKKGPQTRSALC
jgi:hypothetical protein